MKYVPMSVMSDIIGLFLSLAICAISLVIDPAPLTSSCMTIPCVQRVLPVPDGASSFKSKIVPAICITEFFWGSNESFAEIEQHVDVSSSRVLVYDLQWPNLSNDVQYYAIAKAFA